ncbi:hypothetical protein LJR129_005034 [Acidovorax sp. LjRoot129]|uniref:hypothetical protein n=1 Tax=unclassified Acidovorax TaxID=2684926 RepID=UPI003ECFF2B8
MSSGRHGLEHPEYVERHKAQWQSQGVSPVSMIVVEYWGDGDRAFGGNADDRALGPNGVILSTQDRLSTEPAVFGSIDEAHEAAKRIVNRRPDSLLGASISWR